LFTQIKEFMRAETVVLNHPTPVRIYHPGPVLARADPVHPMVFIGKTSSRPTQVGQIKPFKRSHHSFRIPRPGMGEFPPSNASVYAMLDALKYVNMPADRICSHIIIKNDRIFNLGG
jgi:hypothetical protein